MEIPTPMTQKCTEVCGGQAKSPPSATHKATKRNSIAMPPPKKGRIEPASFSMIYWKQQLILIKASQNIKLIEPTAVVGIHNS